jgi:hypothetical protein
MNKCRNASVTVALGSHCKKRKDEESEKQGCGLKDDFCPKYQNTIMLRLDSVKNREKPWVLSKTLKTLRKLLFLGGKKALLLANNSSFLRTDHTEDPCLRRERL